MKKKLYVQPQIVFEDIEEQDCILAAGSNDPEPDITTPEIPEEGGSIWGDGEDDI